MEDEGPQMSAVPNIPEEMIRSFEKAYKRQQKENAFMGRLFREEDNEIPRENLELAEANIFTAQGRAEMAANSAKRSIDKAAKKVDALTKKWTVDNPAPYWNMLSTKTKQNILNVAKQRYLAKFVQQVKLPQVQTQQAAPAQQQQQAPQAPEAPQAQAGRPQQVQAGQATSQN